MLLGTYTLQIKYKSKEDNAIVDTLSRLLTTNKETETGEQKKIKTHNDKRKKKMTKDRK
jgi:hypothetical protein